MGLASNWPNISAYVLAKAAAFSCIDPLLHYDITKANKLSAQSLIALCFSANLREILRTNL